MLNHQITIDPRSLDAPIGRLERRGGLGLPCCVSGAARRTRSPVVTGRPPAPRALPVLERGHTLGVPRSALLRLLEADAPSSGAPLA